MFSVFKRLFRPNQPGYSPVHICIRQRWDGDKNVIPVELVEFLTLKIGDKFRGRKIVAIQPAAFGVNSCKTLTLER